MANDTPDYLANTSYTSILLSNKAFVPATPPVTIPVAQFTSLMASTINNVAGQFVLNLSFTAADGTGLGTVIVKNPVTFSNVKIPVAGATVQVSCVAGNGQLTLLGGDEYMPMSRLAPASGGGGDATGFDSLSYVGPTIAANDIALGWTTMSGNLMMHWSFSTAITGFLFAIMLNGAVFENTNLAGSPEAVALTGSASSLLTKPIFLPAHPVEIMWRPNVTNAGAPSCTVKLFQGS